MSFLRGILDKMFPGRDHDGGAEVDQTIVIRTTTTTTRALERNTLLRAELSALEARLREKRANGGKVRSDGMAR